MACLNSTSGSNSFSFLLMRFMPTDALSLTCSTQMVADVTVEEAAKEEWDLVALPGGMPGRSSVVLVMLITGGRESSPLV